MTAEARVRIYRPRALIGMSGYFHVLIDGIDRGELWPNQVKVFEVSPGHHEMQLKQGLGTRSSLLTFSARSRVGLLSVADSRRANGAPSRHEGRESEDAEAHC